MNSDKEKTKIKNKAATVNSQTEAAASGAKAGTEAPNFLTKGGILLGAIGAGAGLSSFMGANNTETPPVQLHPNTPVVETVKDDMTFEDAFSHARDADGAGAIFNWHGNSYAAWTKEEWDDMTADEQEDFLEPVLVSSDEMFDELEPTPIDEPTTYIGEDPIGIEMREDTENHENLLWSGNPPTEITSGGEVVGGENGQNGSPSTDGPDEPEDPKDPEPEQPDDQSSWDSHSNHDDHFDH